MKDLKSRLQTGQPKSVLLQMEEISTRFLRQELPGHDEQNFNSLLESYLKQTGDRNREQWMLLQQDFYLV